MARGTALEFARGDAGLAVSMPPGGNRWIIGLGLAGGVPWLASFVVGGAYVMIVAPPEMRRTAVLGVIAANLLFFLVHILAVAGIWLAAYNLGGTETLVIGPERIAVLRRGMGITVPMRLKRSADARVRLLDTSLAPGRGPHQRLEVRTGRSAMRFGAGLSAEEAVRVCDAANEVLEAPHAD